MEPNGSRRSTFDVRGRRSGEAAKGTHKLSLWAVPLDGIVSHHFAPQSRSVILGSQSLRDCADSAQQ